MSESKPRRQSKRMMGTHTRRPGAFEAIGFPPGRLALDGITQEDWFGGDSPAVQALAPQMVIGQSGECSSHEPRPMRVVKFTL